MSYLIAPAPSEGTENFLLDEGCYNAVVCGIRATMGTKYNTEIPEVKLQVIFQVAQGDTKHYLTSKRCSNNIGARSNMFAILNGISGYGPEHFVNGFDYSKLLGVPCQLTVKTTVSKKDPNKQYNEIASYLKAKKDDKAQFVPDTEAPWWLNAGNLEAVWCQGLSFKDKPAEQQVTQLEFPQQPATTQGNAPEFMNIPQNMAASAPSPYVAPQPKKSPSTYVPPAAPAPQQPWPAPQNPVVEVDESSDLPF